MLIILMCYIKWMYNIHYIRSRCSWKYLYFISNYKLAYIKIQKNGIINQHMNTTCQMQTLKRTLALVPLAFFCYIWTHIYNNHLALKQHLSKIYILIQHGSIATKLNHKKLEIKSYYAMPHIVSSSCITKILLICLFTLGSLLFLKVNTFLLF
jgi:hypothetical protein